MSVSFDESTLEHRHLDLGDVTLHTVLAGEGPLVVLLHGFPEFWYSWRHQIPALADAGFRVAAIDTRGYNLSSKPKGVAEYHPEKLMQDVVNVIRALGEEKAHVVGHDWGAAIAWMFAMNHADHLDRLVICNVPHPLVMAKHMTTWQQGVKRSWYIYFFQLPWLPERFMLAGDCKSIRSVLRWDPVHKEAFTDEDVERYVEAFKQPGAATSGINYYRAITRLSKDERKKLIRLIENPTLMIWGLQDRYLGPELIDTPESLVKDLRIERIEDASHWVQCDKPDRVNELMIEFLKG